MLTISTNSSNFYFSVLFVFLNLLKNVFNQVWSKVMFSEAFVCAQGGRGTLYDVTTCLAAWSHVPSGGSLSLHAHSGGSVQGSVSGGLCPGGSMSRGSLSGGLCLGGVSVQGDSIPKQRSLPGAVKSGRYTSYWNVFLFQVH